MRTEEFRGREWGRMKCGDGGCGEKEKAVSQVVEERTRWRQGEEVEGGLCQAAISYKETSLPAECRLTGIDGPKR